MAFIIAAYAHKTPLIKYEMKVLATEQWPLCTLILPLKKWMHAFTGGYTLLLLLNFVISEPNKRCFRLKENGSLCFTRPRPPVAMTWSNALQYCKNRGTTLPILHNDDYSTIYENALPNYGSYLDTFWLGANSTYDQNNWHWTNGTCFTGTIENRTVPGKTHAYLKRIGNNVTFVASSPLEEHYRICQANFSEEACTRSNNSWTNGACYTKHSHRYYEYGYNCKQRFLVSYEDLKEASRKFRDRTEVWIGLSCIWWFWHDIVTGRSYEIIRLNTYSRLSTGVYAQCLASYNKHGPVVWYNEDCDREFGFICQHHVNDTAGNITTPTIKSYGSCVVNSSTQRVNNDKVCPDELDKEYSIHWSRTKAGTESYAPCPRNNSGTCSRECKSLGIDGNPLWSAPNCNGCFDKEFKELLEKVNKVNLTAFKNQTVIAKIASQLSTVTNKSEGLSPGNLNASVMMIKQLADLRTERTINANAMEIKSIVQAANNVLQPNNSKSWQELEEVNKNIATSILFSLDVYGRSLAALNTSDHSIEVEDSLVLEAWSFEKSNLREIEFPNGSLWDENRGDGISISVEAFKNSMSSESPSALHMWGSYYRTVNDYLPGNEGGTDDVNSRVLSFSIDGLKTNERLNRPVLITLRHNQEKRTSFQRTCAFWNFSGGNWDSVGCSVTSTNLTHTICSCDHLTNFAILMSLEPKEDWLLSLISIIGCSISVAALILTIFVYALTWKQAKSAQATVLLNLCVALIIAYIIFMVGADKVHSKGFSKIGCQAVAVLLHYFFLAAFFIMLAEGVELLLYIIFVFHVRRTRETVMLVISAWVLPLIVLGVSLGSTKLEGYGHEKACWLSSENHLIWAFVGPVLGIIAANFVILIIVLRWRSQKKALLSKNVKKRDEINATIWNLAVTCPVLGLGWLFGFLTLAFDHTVFQYMFVAVNSVQGLLIFIFHALFHNKRVNERISSLFSTYICSRCRNSDQAVITQSTSSSQDQPTKKADKKGGAPRGGMGKQGNVRGHGTQLTSFGDSETMESTQ